jgi:pimeloyl-ACP methyl ester carboxylesterase
MDISFKVDYRRGIEHMSEPRLKTVLCLDARGLHRMAYWEWGDAANARVAVCVHGLSRQGRDFDLLAQAMLPEYRVVCPDVVGRGRSDHLADPMGYVIPTYVADMVTLIARLDTDSVDWVGTSMGGLIGLALASLTKTPIRRLVLNDVGPTIEPDAIKRIATYLGQPKRFAGLDEAAAFLQSISAGFGTHSRERWLTLSRPMIKPDGDGWVLHYDPQIAVPFRAITPEQIAAGEAVLWRSYDSVSCPTLLLRGADSDLLTQQTAQAMTQRGPKAQLHEVPGVGHAPMLVDPEQIEVVRGFLLAP